MQNPLVSYKRECTCIDKRALLVCIKLKYTQHFPKLRQEITGLKVNLRRLAHLQATPELLFYNNGWMLCSMCWFFFLRKKSKWGLYLNNSRYHYEKWSHADLLRMSWNWRAEECCSFFFFISLAFSRLISIAILRWRGPFAAIHTCCDLYSK